MQRSSCFLTRALKAHRHFVAVLAESPRAQRFITAAAETARTQRTAAQLRSLFSRLSGRLRQKSSGTTCKTGDISLLSLHFQTSSRTEEPGSYSKAMPQQLLLVHMASLGISECSELLTFAANSASAEQVLSPASRFFCMSGGCAKSQQQLCFSEGQALEI